MRSTEPTKTVMISNVSPSSLTFDDMYNTLKYADRAKRIKVRLKKNVVSVDFHVGQYAKIVDGMKREIDDWKAKAAALAEENSRLKGEVSCECRTKKWASRVRESRLIGSFDRRA